MIDRDCRKCFRRVKTLKEFKEDFDYRSKNFKCVIKVENENDIIYTSTECEDYIPKTRRNKK